MQSPAFRIGISTRMIVGVLAIALSGLTALPVMAQVGPQLPADTTPTSLIFTSDKSALEAPFNSGAPDFSTATLQAYVTDANNNPVKGASVAFASGNAYIPDLSGSVGDYELQLTNEEGVATTTYTTNQNTAEDFVDLYATLIIDPAAPTQSENIIARHLQVVINNVADTSNPQIDSAAAPNVLAEEELPEEQRTAQDLADEVRGQNGGTKVEMDLRIAAADNLDSEVCPEGGCEWVDMVVDLRAATSDVSSNQAINLGTLNIEYKLEISDQKVEAANLNQYSQGAYLPWTQTQTSVVGTGENAVALATRRAENQETNRLYLNSRAWGSRDFKITARLVSDRSPHAERLAKETGAVAEGDRRLVLGESTVNFHQENPEQPELKIEVTPSESPITPDTRHVTIQGTITANGEKVGGQISATLSSTDDVDGRLTGEERSMQGEFIYTYYPEQDGKEREITITFTGQVAEGPNGEVSEEFGDTTATLVLKQVKEETAEAEDPKDDDTRVLLGEAKSGDYELRVYGNRSEVIAQDYFQAFGVKNIEGVTVRERGTTIYDLSTKNGYRDGPASYMILEAEVTNTKLKKKIVGDRILGSSPGRVTKALYPRESNLMAAENAQDIYFTRQDGSSGVREALIDEEGKATFYYAAGNIPLQPKETTEAKLEFVYRDIELIVPVPIVSKYDFLGDGDKNDPIQVSITQPIVNAPQHIKDAAKQDPTWNGASLVQIKAQSPKGPSIGGNVWQVTLSGGQAYKYATMDPKQPIVEAPILGQVTLSGSGPDYSVFINPLGKNVNITITAHQVEKAFSKQITIRAGSNTPSEEDCPIQPCPPGEDDGEGDGEEDIEGGGDSGEEGNGEEDGQGESGEGDTPAEDETQVTESDFGISTKLYSQLNLVKSGAANEVTLSINIPNNIVLPDNDGDGELIIRVKPFQLQGKSKVTFYANTSPGVPVPYVVEGAGSSLDPKAKELSLSASGITLRLPPYKRGVSELGVFKFEKSAFETDEFGVTVFIAPGEVNANGSTKRVLLPWRLVNTIPNLSYFNSLGSLEGWGITKMGVSFKVGLEGGVAPKQTPGTTSGGLSEANSNGGDEENRAANFTFDPSKPIRNIDIDSVMDSAASALKASPAFSGRDKDFIDDKMSTIKGSLVPYTINAQLGALQSRIGSTGASPEDKRTLYRIVANLWTELWNQVIKNDGQKFSQLDQQFMDQATAEIVGGNHAAIKDLSTIKTEGTRIVSDLTKAYGLAGIKIGATSNPLIDGAFASTINNAADGVVSLVDIFTNWLSRTLNLR